MTPRSGTHLPTILEQIVTPEPITRDDFIDDLRGAAAELDRPAGEQVDRRQATPVHDRAAARPRRALAE
jgi:hypothetical protein